MYQLVNQDTRVIRELDLHTYFRGNIKVIEVLHPGVGAYLDNYTRPDKPPLEMVVETLAVELLKNERIRARFLKNMNFKWGTGGIFTDVFKREPTSESDVRYTSEAFGIEIRGSRVGKNWSFDVSPFREGGHSTGKDDHEAARKILQEGVKGTWSHRLSEIRVQIPFGHTCHKEKGNDTWYGFSPRGITEDVLRFVPFDSTRVESKMMFDSFTSADNPGIQVGTMRDMPVYLRFACEEHNEGRYECQQRRAAALAEENGTLFLREGRIVAEFFVKSAAHRMNHLSPKDIDYRMELRKMGEVAQVLYVGIWQYANSKQ